MSLNYSNKKLRSTQASQVPLQTSQSINYVKNQQNKFHDKVKISQMSLGNISVNDERSTDIQDESSYSLHLKNAPYKTLSTFNNMKTQLRTGQKLQGILPPHNNNKSGYSQNSQQPLFKDQFKTYKKKNKFLMNPELNSERGDQVKSLLLRIDEDIKEEQIRHKPPKHTKENLTKVNSKTEFPELKSTSINQQARIKNNQSISSHVVPQYQGQTVINSQTSSRT